MKVREIMTTEVATAAPDNTLDEIAVMMKNEDAGSIPIVADGELRGILTDRDIVIRCIAEGKEPTDTTAEEILSEALHTIEPDAEVEEASELMAEQQIRRLPVVEENRLVGILAIGDIAVNEDEETAGETLEEVSRGVKGGGQERMNNQRAGRSKTNVGRYQQGSARGRDDAPRGKRDQAAGGRYGSSATRPSGAKRQGAEAQGISNRGAGRETVRQQTVNPQRAGKGDNKRRRAS